MSLKIKGTLRQKVKHAKAKEFNFEATNNGGRNSILPIQDIKSKTPSNSLASWCKDVDFNVRKKRKYTKWRSKVKDACTYEEHVP